MAEARRAIPSLGGYDEEFVNAVEDDWQCAICQLLLKEPIQTKCGHRFCKQCLDEHFRRLEIDRQQSCCPVDRNHLIQNKDIFDDKATERKILSLIIKCPNKDCDWTGELRSKENHLLSCPMTLICCPFAQMGCSTKTQRSEIESHLQSVAGLRLHLDLACVKLYNTQETTRKLEEKINSLEKMIPCSEEDSYYTWKISGFSEVMRQAKSKERTFIKSSPFYRYGYKCRLRLDPNGQGSGENTHLTISFTILKGEYDAILPWPLHKKLTFRLIDQQENPNDRKNIVGSVKTNPKLRNFVRPVTNENPGLGFFQFISHRTLRERHYIVDDVVYIQVQLAPAE